MQVDNGYVDSVTLKSVSMNLGVLHIHKEKALDIDQAAILGWNSRWLAYEI